MNRKTIFIFSVVMLLSLVLSGCSQTGNEYVGKWVDTTTPRQTMEIKRNDSNFIVILRAPSFWDGEIEQKEVPGIYKDNSIVVSAGRQAIISYVKADDSLLFVGKTFSRLTEPKAKELEAAEQKRQLEKKKKMATPTQGAGMPRFK